MTHKFTSLGPLEGFLCERYTNCPQGRYLHLFVLRETQSEAIFRTEGTGEPLTRESVRFADRSKANEHVVITKRKTVAVERRTGRELLRRLALLRAPEKGAEGEVCLLNTNNPCERCIDCWLYGFAAGSGGAQKSRIMTEDSFSLLPAEEVVDSRTGNATYDNGTMRHPVTGKASQALYESEYVKPQTVFLDIQTLKDVQPAEFFYVLGNILRSSRYGAIGTRIGHVSNRLLAIAGSDYELTSNLQWTDATIRALVEREALGQHPMSGAQVSAVATEQARGLLRGAMGATSFVEGDALEAIVAEASGLYETTEKWLAPLADSFDALSAEFSSKKKKKK